MDQINFNKFNQSPKSILYTWTSQTISNTLHIYQLWFDYRTTCVKGDWQYNDSDRQADQNGAPSIMLRDSDFQAASILDVEACVEAAQNTKTIFSDQGSIFIS